MLSEPHAGFKIAFNMFDADGNEMVDKREFLVVRASTFNVKIPSIVGVCCVITCRLPTSWKRSSARRKTGRKSQKTCKEWTSR